MTAVDMDFAAVTKRIEDALPGLSPQLRQAARFVLSRPDDVALHSMRELAARAGVHPSTMVRLAQQLEYDGFPAFREPFRQRLRNLQAPYSDRARSIQARGRTDGAAALVREIAETDRENLEATFEAIGAERLEAVARRLSGCRRLLFMGQRSCFPVAFYLHYACRMFRDDVTLLEGSGGTVGDTLRGLGPDDAVMAISVDPYSREVVGAARYAASRRAWVVALTDSTNNPLASAADEVLVFANASPSLFSSMVSAMAVAQTLTALLLAEGGEKALRTVAESERQLAGFGTYWDDAPAKYGLQ